MAEYIEREAAIVICEKTYQERIRMSDWCGDTVAWNIGHEIKALPDADVQPVRHGRWITKEYMYGDPDVGIEDMWVDRLAEQSDYFAYCSICGKDAGYTAEGELVLSGFCPTCGADMRGVQSVD